MTKKDLPLITAIIITIIVFLISIYTLSVSDRDIDNVTFIMLLVAFAIYTVFIIIMMTIIHNKKSIKPEKALLIIMPVFCILLSIAMPVGRGHDETMHWYKAFEVSQGTLMTPIMDKYHLAVAELPKGVENIVFERKSGEFKYADIIPLFNVEIDYEKTIKMPNQNSAAYCFIQYIPDVTGILIGKLITQNPLTIAYIARIINMCTCIALMYFAIKIIPFGKNILLTLAIIPIAIEGFATLSPDGLTIAICALFIAYTMNIAFNKEKKCGVKEVAILTILGAIVSLCKIVYMPLIFLVLIIPKGKFKNKKSRMISIILILSLGVILNLIWLFFGSMALLNSNTHTYTGSEYSGTMIKVSAILNNPFLFLQKVFYTFGMKFDQYFLSLFGGQLEWGEVVKIEIVPYAIFIISILAVITDRDLKVKFERYQKIIISLIIIIITFLIFTSLFIQWSDNELPYIDGIQGRYFLPILPLILFIVAGVKIRTHYKNLDITKLICISSFVIQLYTIANVMANHI